MNGWVEERWAARGWGGGEGRGIMEPMEAAARKGVELALPSLILPSDRLLYLTLLWALGPWIWLLWAPGGREAIYHLGALGRKSLC